MGMALSGGGLWALFCALTSLSDFSSAQGPLLGASSELPFLEELLNHGQGKGYPGFPQHDGSVTVLDHFVMSQLIASSPHARRAFPRNDEIEDLFQFIVSKSREYHLSPLLVLSLIDVESGFQPGAVSRRGAVGLMQLQPATAEEVANQAGIIWYPDLLKDPKANVELGLRYMKKLQDQFGSSLEDVLTAYNIGPKALRDKRSLGEDVSLDYFRRVSLGMRVRGARLPRGHARLWARAWL